ncbi:MAG: phage tail tape measure protein [Bacteroidales bacterium]
MGKTNITDYRFSIFINNDQAKRSLIEMEKTMIGYEAELAKLVREKKTETQQYKDAKKVYEAHLQDMAKLRQEAGLQALSLKELKSLRTQLNNELARTIPGSAHREKLEKEFRAVNSRVSELQVGAANTGLSFGKLADAFNKYFAIATAGVAVLTGFGMAVMGLVKSTGELSDSLANIRKTTGMTADEVNKLNTALGKIDTRTSRKELREMAVVAGQLGMAREDVFAFVESVDRLNVALGDEFTGGAEQVAKEMGMLRNVLTDVKTTNVSMDMLSVGNAINALGAAGFATGPVLVDFASRIAGIGIPLGLTSDEVLGLSATLQELNVNAERGGTAVQKILQKMTRNTADFAKVAGMSVVDFTNLVNEDLFAAFKKVMEGSQLGGQSATALSGIIKELEISGAGASEIFAKLGGNSSMLAEKVTLAGKSLQNTDSITAEFNVKNQTLGAVIDKLSKEWYRLISMPGVTQFFTDQVMNVVSLVNWLKDLPLIIEKYRIALIAVGGATLAWIAAKTRSMQVSIMNNLTMKEGILLKIKDGVVMEYLIVKEQMLTIWKGNGTVATKLAATAQWLWNAAMAANPLGLVIAGITALVIAVKTYDKYNAEAIALEKSKGAATAFLTSANEKLKQSYSEIESQIKSMNIMSKVEKQALSDKIKLTLELAKADLLAAQARQKAIGEQAAKPTLFQKGIAAFSGPVGIGGLAVASAENSQEAMAPFNEGINKLKDQIAQLEGQRQSVTSILFSEASADKVLAKTQEALTEKLNKYQTALRNTVAGSEEYIRIQGKIKDTNKELAKFDNSDPSAEPKGEGKKVKTRLEEINRQIEEYLGLLQKQIEKEPEKAAATAKEIASLKAQKKSIEDLLQSYLALAEGTDIATAKYSFEDSYQFRKNAGIATADEVAYYEINKLKETNGWAIASEIERAAAIKKIRMDAGVNTDTLPDGTPIEEWTPDNYASNKKSDDASQEAAFQDNGALDVNLWGAKAEAFMGYANTVMNGMMGIDQAMSAYENSQLAKDQKQNDQKKLNLKRQLDAKTITQKQYDAGIAKLDQEMDVKKRELQVKQAKRQKALSLVQAIISTAQAVVTALSAGPIIGIILAALVGILGAVQIGYIASTPIPEAFRGRYTAFRKASQAAMGRYDVLGQEDNKMYRGVPYQERPESGIYSSPTLFAETGREIILNPKHTENLMRFRPDLVDAIMKVPQRSVGLYPEPSAQKGSATQQITVKFDQDTLDEMKNFRDQLKKPLSSNIVYEDMRSSMDTVAAIEKSVTR